MAERLQVQIAAKSSLDNFWKSSIDANLYTKAAPDFYERIEVFEGDAISEGSIYTIHMGKGAPFASFEKVKVVEIDTANKIAKYEFIDGDILEYYKTYKVGAQITPKGDGEEGCLINWYCEYEKKSPEIPDPTSHIDAISKILGLLDAYLLKA